MASSARTEWPFADLRLDRVRFGPRAWLIQPSLWAVLTYRLCRAALYAPAPLKPFAHSATFIAYLIVRLITGIDIPRGVTIGGGFMIHHFGGVVIGNRTQIGRGCTIRHGVTIGNSGKDEDCPVIGDCVEVGVGATILGGIVVGRDSVVGAGAVVIHSVEPGTVVVGVPARPVSRAERFVGEDD